MFVADMPRPPQGRISSRFGAWKWIIRAVKGTQQSVSSSGITRSSVDEEQDYVRVASSLNTKERILLVSSMLLVKRLGLYDLHLCNS